MPRQEEGRKDGREGLIAAKEEDKSEKEEEREREGWID